MTSRTQERQLQIDLKNRKDAAIKKREQRWAEHIVSDANAAADEEEQRFRQQREKQRELREMQLEQIRLREARKAREKQVPRPRAVHESALNDVREQIDQEEGELLRLQAEQYDEEERRKANARRERSRAMKLEATTVNSNLQV